MECQIVDLISQMDPKTGKKAKRKPTFVRASDVVIAKIACEGPVPCERFKEVAALGRFSLRDEGKTIAIGKFTELFAQSTVKKDDEDGKAT